MPVLKSVKPVGYRVGLVILLFVSSFIAIVYFWLKIDALERQGEQVQSKLNALVEHVEVGPDSLSIGGTIESRVNTR